LDDEGFYDVTNSSDGMFVRMCDVIPLNMMKCLTEQERICAQMCKEAALEAEHGEGVYVLVWSVKIER
jgi:hypothetical protein